MKDIQIYDKKVLKKLPEINFENTKAISYSQFSLYHNCPKAWQLKYILKNKEDEPSIHLIFGTAFHTTFQYLIFCYFQKSVKFAEALDVEDMLKTELKSEFQKMKIQYNKNFSSPAELTEFYNDGIEILKYFKKKRATYFPTRNYELVGIEIPIWITLKEGTINKVVFLGYIDLVVKDKRDGEYILYDIKTSTSGWNDYKKKDSLTTSQLVLYKKFFAEQYGIELTKIKVQYFIVRRKIREDLEFPIKRIQEFSPAAGSVTLNKVGKMVTEFVTKSFTDTGEYNTSGYYPPLAGKEYKNCKFCKFNSNDELCPKENRITQID